MARGDIKDGKAVNMKLTPDDEAAADALQKKFGLSSRCDTIRLALRIAQKAEIVSK